MKRNQKIQNESLKNNISTRQNCMKNQRFVNCVWKKQGKNRDVLQILEKKKMKIENK